MARCVSMILTRGLLMCRLLIRLTRTVMLPHTEMTSKTLYVAMDNMCPSLKVMSMGKSTVGFLLPSMVELLLLLKNGPSGPIQHASLLLSFEHISADR